VTVDFLKPVIGPDMVGVDQVLRDSLRSDVALIHTVADYIIGSGGKPAGTAEPTIACSPPWSK
jgi:hypothetical protein